MAHEVGDVVRLNRGWTPMIVLRVHNNRVTATYCQEPTDWHFAHPEQTNGYTRHQSGFTAWDGQPINWSKKKMAKQYEVAGAGRRGTYLTKTSQGAFVLEFSDGSTEHFDPRELIEIIPFTFSVKAVGGNNYKTHYSLPSNASNLAPNDLLISDSGNLYIVTNVNTQFTGSLKEFRGKRLVAQAI